MRKGSTLAVALTAILLVITGTCQGATDAVTLENLPLLGNRVRNVDLSSDGSWIAVELVEELVILEKRTGAIKFRLGPGLLPVWAPHTPTLVFYSSRSGELQLWTWTLGDAVPTQSSHVSGGIDADPTTRVNGKIGESLRVTWSPDGSRIAFASRVHAQLVKADNEQLGDEKGGAPMVLTESTPPEETLAGVFVHPSGVSGVVEIKDGHTITLRDARPVEDQFSQIFVLNLRDRSTAQITHGKQSFFHPDWSPDGKTIVCVKLDQVGVPFAEGLTSELLLIDVGTYELRALAAGDGLKFGPRWSPDGSVLMFTTSKTALAWHVLNYIDFSRNPLPVQLPFFDRHIDAYRWYSDGKSIVAAYQDGTSERLGRIVLGDSRMVEISPHSTVPLEVDSFGVSGTGDIVWCQYDPLDLTTIRTQGNADQKPRTIARLNPTAEGLRRGRVQTLNWRNERGEELEGSLLLPPDYRSGVKYPLIIDAYPLLGGSDWSYAGTSNFAWASMGYAVFRPSPRAPHVWMNHWKDEASSLVAKGAKGWDITVDDILSGVNELIRLGAIDSNKMCLYGFSNGGGVVDYLVTRTNRFRCAVSLSPALTDWLRPALLTSNFPQWAAGASLDDDLADYTKLSAVFHLASVQTPMLIAAGDQEVDFLLDAVEMYNGLRRLGKNVTLIRYPGQEHGLTGEALKDFWSRVSAFYQTYLLPGL